MAAKRRAKPAARKERKPAKPRRAERAAKAAPVADEEKPAMPLESALAVATGIMLIVALLLLDYEKGAHYGTGMFFKGSYGAQAEGGE
ncbi:MAG: hypothetical protein D6702_13035 [Planctomycetota bacterium]|nr:MAG: hypothetical protein D6702_13035 [Planctomycetota bacterium]